MTCLGITWMHLLLAAISAVLGWTLYAWASGLLYIVALGGGILILTAVLLVFAGGGRRG